MKKEPEKSSHGFKPGTKWPRYIAKEFVEGRQDTQWVWNECKKHEHPHLIWQWVTDLITLTVKRLGEKPNAGKDV